MDIFPDQIKETSAKNWLKKRNDVSLCPSEDLNYKDLEKEVGRMRQKMDRGA